MIAQILDEVIEVETVYRLIEASGFGVVGAGSRGRHGISVVHDRALAVGLQFRENGFDPLLIGKDGSRRHFESGFQRERDVFGQFLRPYGEHGTVIVEFSELAHDIIPEGNVPRVHSDVDGEVVIGVLRRVNATEDAAEQAVIRHVFLRHLSDVEEEVRVGDAVGLDRMENGFDPADRPFLVVERDRIAGNIGTGERRNAVLFFLGRLMGLIFAQETGLFNDMVDFLGRKGFLIVLELLLQGLVVFVDESTLRRKREKDGVVGLEDDLLDEVLVITGADSLLQLSEIVEHVHISERGFFIVQPGLKHIRRDVKTARIAAVIRLAEMEFADVQSGENGFLVEALFDLLFQGVPNDFPETVEIFFVCVLRDDGEAVFDHMGVVAAVHILADTGFEQRLLERRAVVVQKNGGKNAPRTAVEHVKVRSAEYGIGEKRFSVHGIVFPDRIRLRHAAWSRFAEARLRRDLGGRGDRVKRGEIVLVHPFEPLVHIAVPVKEDIGVRGMIMRAVEFEIILVAQLGDDFRIAAGIDAVGGVGQEAVVHFIPDRTVGRGHRALHFGINDAVDFQFVLRIFKLVMPSFLHEDLAVAVNVRIEDRVHIDVHEVFKILVVAGSDGIESLVRVSHRVEEGIEGTFRELHERIAGREILRAAENGMLNDVRYARGILRRSAERGAEQLIFVFVRKHGDTRAGFLMPQNNARGLDVVEIFLILKLICTVRRQIGIRFDESHTISFHLQIPSPLPLCSVRDASRSGRYEMSSDYYLPFRYSCQDGICEF